MAWTLIANIQGAPVGAGGVTTGAIDTTGAHGLFVAVEGVAPFTVTDSNGNVYTGRTRQGESQIFDSVIAPTVGAGHTFTVTGIVTNIQVTAWASPTGNIFFDVESGSGTPVPGSLTPTFNDSLLITGIAGQFTQTYTIDTGFTISDQFPGSGVAVPGAQAYLNLAVAAATSPTWTVTGSGSRDSTMAVYSPLTSGVGARTAQIAAEVLSAPDPGSARTAQIVAEALSAPLPGLARTAQIVVEVLHSLNPFVPPSGGTGVWFRDLWDEEMLDDPGDVWQE